MRCSFIPGWIIRTIPKKNPEIKGFLRWNRNLPFSEKARNGLSCMNSLTDVHKIRQFFHARIGRVKLNTTKRPPSLGWDGGLFSFLLVLETVSHTVLELDSGDSSVGDEYPLDDGTEECFRDTRV